ncbi:hypothetical protein Asi03nite_66010 [Actinoplanes siamensis]|uniref:Uncharacterized protein n=1 Tax=Actinoplanes siamensis TaxID=1223317 RepID=A0A919NDT2_9ACTN|nr:hypothetical protein [Actinoplanes siamensis]GIF09063.1 hypothetical protein Asi03nite_66010 [Actinoplanes siamensis]
MLGYWSGALVAGRSVTRDRAAEFTAAGPVAAPLPREVAAVRERLAADVRAADPAAPLHAEPPAAFQGGS